MNVAVNAVKEAPTPPRTTRRTTEQQLAARELATAAPGYRVAVDANGWPSNPGKYGRLEHLGATPGGPGQLAAYTTSRRICTKLAALPGARRHQAGDDEFRVLLASCDAVIPAARLLRCHRRRSAPANAFPTGLSPRPRATSRAVEARS